MFIRIKKIKGKQYAYLVTNTWKKRKQASRQKTLKYLGRVIKVEKKENHQTDPGIELFLNKPPADIIRSLVEKELTVHGFIPNNHRWTKEGIKIDLRKKEVKDQNNKDICLEMNHNFFCEYTLKKLLIFSPKEGLTQLQIGKELAVALEATGIPINKELFVLLFQKIVAQIEKTK